MLKIIQFGAGINREPSQLNEFKPFTKAIFREFFQENVNNKRDAHPRVPI